MLPVLWGRPVTLIFLGGSAPIESVDDARAVGYTLFALIFILLLKKIHANSFYYPDEFTLRLAPIESVDDESGGVNFFYS
jgi:hypothetical protein